MPMMLRVEGQSTLIASYDVASTLFPLACAVMMRFAKAIERSREEPFLRCLAVFVNVVAYRGKRYTGQAHGA